MEIKDKKITRQRHTYTATIEYFQDRSDLSRDEDHPVTASFTNDLKAAQAFLAGFPPDCFDGTEHINQKPLN